MDKYGAFSNKLPRGFYLQDDVVLVARNLLGKVLCTNLGSGLVAGMIVEAEAYAGVNDRASHAYGHRLTGRTQVMFGLGGTAYVYLCYGVHHLFNVVTNQVGIPHAVLIRGIIPVEGFEAIGERIRKPGLKISQFNGPGKVTNALGIKTSHSGTDLLEDKIWISDISCVIPEEEVQVTARIGVDYAGTDAGLPYRFLVSEKWQQNLLMNAAK